MFVQQKKSSVRSAEEEQLWYLAPLHPGPIGAVRRTLKLEGDLPTLHFGQPFLPKVAEFRPIQHRTGRVEGVLLNLDRIVKEHGEGVAGPVRLELGHVLAEEQSVFLQLDSNEVLGRAVARPVKPEAHDENALVDGELDAVTAPAVAPLVAAVGGGLEAVDAVLDQTFAVLAVELQLRFVVGCEVKEDVGRLLSGQHARLRGTVGKLLQAHGWHPHQVETGTQHLRQREEGTYSAVFLKHEIQTPCHPVFLIVLLQYFLLFVFKVVSTLKILTSQSLYVS